MMPPTSIDGTDITGATIDGTDVQEITVDGDTVFTAGPTVEPVAYSNLVAWYPFDSATYGGSNADDVTALFNPAQSGDSTAYDGTVNGATYQSSGGVTDINAGANSGAFDFDTNDNITFDNATAFAGNEYTICMWLKSNEIDRFNFFDYPGGTTPRIFAQLNGDANGNVNVGQTRFFTTDDSGPGSISPSTNPNLNDGAYHHVAYIRDFSESANGRIHIDGGSKEALTIQNTGIVSGSQIDNDVEIGGDTEFGTGNIKIEDLRLYNTALSGTQINDIYQNTEP